MCDEAVDTYHSLIKYAPDQFKTQEMCDKAVFRCRFVFDSVPDQYKTQKISDKMVSEDPFKLKYCHNRCKTQEMCHKAVDDFLPALKFDLDWFVTSKMIKNYLLVYTLMIIYYF